MTTHIPQKVPEHFSRVDIGAYMRELRLHYGLSEQDVSERLHIRIKYVTAIENAQFDLMPGKAYARGYVHTYAEFLGLDADQIVERCFGGEMAREVQAHSIPESSNWYKRNKAYGGVLAVLLLLGGLFYVARQSDTAPDSPSAEVSDGVESVPEEYLSSMRTRLMPTANNYDCLGDAASLGCYRDQRLTKQWLVPNAAPAMAPAPADAYPDIEQEEEIDAVMGQAPVVNEPAKPAEKKAEPKKPTLTKAAEKLSAKERKKLGDNYPGYYIPPKPNLEEAPPALPTPQAPATKPEETISEPKPDEPAPAPEPKADE